MLYSPVPMHIPDNFLSIAVSLICWAITAVTLGIAISRTNKSLGEKQVPLMGVMAAFIFAAQMINFPVGAGTSGHLMGGALAAVLVGPWSAVLCLSVVLLVQALLMADGGITALGTNITLIGLVTVAVGWTSFVVLRRLLPPRTSSVPIAAAIGAFLSITPREGGGTVVRCALPEVQSAESEPA